MSKDIQLAPKYSSTSINKSVLAILVQIKCGQHTNFTFVTVNITQINFHIEKRYQKSWVETLTLLQRLEKFLQILKNRAHSSSFYLMKKPFYFQVLPDENNYSVDWCFMDHGTAWLHLSQILKDGNWCMLTEWEDPRWWLEGGSR
jgi:hypothetical protein